MATILKVPAGFAQSWRIDLIDATKAKVAFQAGDAPSAKVWAGGGGATVITPACQWLTPADTLGTLGYQVGAVRLSVVAADTANVPAGLYRLLMGITPAGGGDFVPAFEAEFRVEESPGTGAATQAYCTYRDMLRYANWLGKVQGGADTAGFADQRAGAAEWLNRVVEARYSAWWQRGRGYEGWRYDSALPASIPETLKKAGGLISSPRVVEMAARYAVGLVGESRLIPGDESHDPYLDRAERCMCRAQQMAGSWAARLDLSSPPVPSAPVVGLVVGPDSVAQPWMGPTTWPDWWGL